MRVPTLLLSSALLATLAACQPAAPVAQADATDATGAKTASVAQPAAPARMTDAQLLEHGDYLVRIAGCHDCHTPGWADGGGDAPRDLWLVGSPVGFHGPWGTTYAANLRMKVADMDDAQWLAYTATLHTRPIMPDFAVRAMKEQDRLAIFRYLKSLGPGGQAAPAYLPPGQTPPPPFFELKLPPQAAQQAPANANAANAPAG